MRRVLIGFAGWLALASAATAAQAVRIRFGQLSDGTVVDAVELTNGHGMKARVIAYGAALQALEVRDRAGHSEDVVFGYCAANHLMRDGMMT